MRFSLLDIDIFVSFFFVVVFFVLKPPRVSLIILLLFYRIKVFFLLNIESLTVDCLEYFLSLIWTEHTQFFSGGFLQEIFNMRIIFSFIVHSLKLYFLLEFFTNV